jgi:serine phosphatase RsbU (regulator of sigma subunit)
VWQRVNRLLCDNISGRLNDNRYVTAQLLTHRGDGRFVCVGAHQSPMVYRQASNRVELVDSTGPWLGIDPTQNFVPVSEIQLAPGDVLCLYSDGLPEAQDKAGDLFDVDRLAASLQGALARTNVLADAANAVYSAVEAFSNRRDDDWTMLLIRYRHDASRHVLADNAA